MAFNLSSIIVKKEQKKPVSIVYDKDWNISFDIIHLSKVEFQSLIGKHTKLVFDPKTNSKEEKPDFEKLNEEIASTCVKGWHGVTFKWLKTQIVIDEAQVKDENAEIEFSTENFLVLLKNAYGLDNWLIDTIRNAANFNDEKKEEERKN